MMLFHLNPRSQRYDLLKPDEDEPDTLVKSPSASSQRPTQSRLPQWISHISVAFFGIAFGLVLAKWWDSDVFGNGYIQPSGHTSVTWYPNHTFSSTASPTSEEAWKELVPRGRGFIFNSHLAPKNKSIAVFHQLHCLHAIKLAYDSRVNEIYKLQKKPELVNPYLDTIGANTQQDHVAHCIDILRQALMCHADSNLEDITKTGATTGWAFPRTCRDFGALFAWTEKWRVIENDRKGLLGE